jgi:type IV pilus assembly protein PilV
MVEVMVAVLVVSIGLLGIAKMQALALASTGTAKMRSLASIEAASLASTMRADRAYWAAITSPAATPFVVTVNSTGAITATGDTTLQTAGSTCSSTATVCTSNQVAALDLSIWATGLVATLPAPAAGTSNAVISCIDTPPVSCTITLNWNENVVAMNTSTNTAATQTQNSNALKAITATTYTVYVDP